MPVYYSVDRCGFYQQNTQYNLTPMQLSASAMTAQAFEQFASGISQHGVTYFIGKQGKNFHVWNDANHPSAVIEYALELLRKQRYPEKPSRFLSMFGCEKLDEAKHFRGWSKSNLTVPIYEVHTDKPCHKGDMNILRADCAISEFDRRLNSYWSGETYPLFERYEPLWEMIIPLPVLMGSRIE